MAIKKQKRSIDEAIAEENGATGKKVEKNIKKIKTEKVPETNGISIKKALKQQRALSQIVGKKPAEQKVKIVKKEISEGAQKTKIAEKLLKKKEQRKESRIKTENMNFSAEELRKRIENIQARTELTKTAKRRLGVLKKKLAIADGTYVPKPIGKAAVKVPGALSKSAKRHLRKKKSAERRAQLTIEEGGDAKVGKKNKNKNVVKTEGKKLPSIVVKQEKVGKKAEKGKGAKKLPVMKVEAEESDDDDEEEEDSDEAEDDSEEEGDVEMASEEEDDSEEEEDSDEEEEDDSEEELDDSSAGILNTSEEKSDGDDDEEDDEDDDEDDEDDEEEVKYALAPKKEKAVPEKKPFVKKEEVKKDFVKKEPAANGEGAKKKRFVLFVGNLSYEAGPEDIKKHFLTKVSNVLSVRVPTKPGSNSPRGIAYVELTNETDYQKGLALHNTTINGRRINVEYTQGGSKSVGNRSEIVGKNKKLHAMRKGGMFAGKRDNRNDRRQKQKQNTSS